MKIYNLVKYSASAIAAVFLLLAAITLFGAGSDVRKKDNAKNMMMYILIGLVVIWATPTVVSFLL